MIIGTAGHIDHGKTTLVRALTGVDTDRLREEKKRGITIELGFAHVRLDDGTVAGVVDVPGHERFVKAMVAGAGGVDLVVLVVAADEGVMPQTREHLDICRLLGVQAGVIAVTKADLLDELGPEWMELLELDLQGLVQDTFLEGAKIIPVSGRTGQGVDALRTELTRLAKSLPARPAEGPTFLPLDRAFILKGFGTVVTGTLLSGTLAVEESVSLLPGLEGPWRVRGIQVHGEAVQKATAGQRVAVNVVGLDADAVSRGMVLTRFEELPPVRMLDVELQLLPGAETPLSKRSRLLLHLGTAQVECVVALLDTDELRPGESALAQLRLATPIAALPNQRFILRGSKILPGRGATVAGGRVLALSTSRRRRGATEMLQPLLEGELDAKLAWLLRQAGYRGLNLRELAARAAVSPKIAEKSLQLLLSRGTALLVDRDKRQYLSGEVFAGMGKRAVALLEAFHAREPMREGMSKEELRQRISPELEPRTFARLLSHLVETKRAEADGELLRLPGRTRTLGVKDETARATILSALEGAGLAPPRVDELAGAAKVPEAKALELLRVLASQGEVIRVSDELWFHPTALAGLKAKLVDHLKAHQEITTQAFKELVGQSRKYVIPLSEYFDREKVTLRVGEKRILRRG